jgi:hypothetical protein
MNCCEYSPCVLSFIGTGDVYSSAVDTIASSANDATGLTKDLKY